MKHPTSRYHGTVKSFIRQFQATGPHLRTVLFICAAGLIAACSGSLQLNSQSLDREITIDGDTNDWHDVLRPTEKDQRVSVGAINDDQYLYLVVTTRNRDHIRSMVRTGLTTHFEAGERGQNRFGIRYPLGLATSEDGESQTRVEGDPDVLRARWKRQLSELEILLPGAPTQRLPVEGLGGIRTAATLSSGLLICEFQIPLQQSTEHQYAIGTAPGETIDVTIETPRPDRPEMDQNTSTGPTAAGGMRGNRRGRQRQPMSSDNTPSMARLDLKTQIQLAP